MPFKQITDQQHAAFISALKAGQYNLMLGAGASMDAENGLGPLPSSDAFKAELCELKGVGSHYNLQRVFELLDEDETDRYVTRRFSHSTPGFSAKAISSFLWKRVFTWNIDDVLENAYRKSGLQRLVPKHFKDDYVEIGLISDLILVHLHGSVLQPEKGYVFSRSEYVGQIVNINPWMTVLTQFMRSEPIIISGTSMDEIDLDFYLAHRSEIASREDKGPSVLVELADDAITASICKKHNLLHFIGYTSDFLQYCQAQVPHPPTPVDLVPVEAAKLIPSGTSKAASLAFHSDFELVPGSATPNESESSFLYGHPPTWGDLAADTDVSRALTSRLLSDIQNRLMDDAQERLIVINEHAGTGKTTVLLRVAFELAQRGVKTLYCSALSRIKGSTAGILDLIDMPVVIIVDNFAEQVTSIADLMARLEKRDVVILAAERSYRITYLQRVLGKIGWVSFNRLKTNNTELERLLDLYQDKGLVGAYEAKTKRSSFIQTLSRDPIAVSCCRIMNDFKPLDRIVAGLIAAASPAELSRYLLCALAQHCFKGGIRLEVFLSSTDNNNISAQFSTDH